MVRIVHARISFRIGTFWCGAAIALGIAVAGASDAHASVSAGCASSSSGDLGVVASAGQSATRQLSLVPGETLTISLETPATGTVALVSGSGASRTLYSGASSSVAFAVPSAASYVFRVTADGGAPATMRVKCVSRAQAQQDFLSRTTGLLTSKTPDRTRIDRPATALPTPEQMQASETEIGDNGKPKPANVSISMSEIAAAGKPGVKREPSIIDFWLEGRYEPYETGLPDSGGNLGVVSVGSSYKLGPDIMVGALAQFDRAYETEGAAGSDLASDGWLAGPYMSVRFGPGVIFDGRAAWGAAESGMSGLAIERTPADRRLVSGTLRGERPLGSWTFAPSVGLSYVEDTPAVAAAGESQPVPAGQGRLEVLPQVKRKFQVNSDTYVEPRAGVGGYMSFDTLSKVNPTALAAEAGTDVHMKAEAGVAVGVKDGMNVEASGGVETGDETVPENWMGRLQLNMPFGK